MRRWRSWEGVGSMLPFFGVALLSLERSSSDYEQISMERSSSFSSESGWVDCDCVGGWDCPVSWTTLNNMQGSRSVSWSISRRMERDVDEVNDAVDEVNDAVDDTGCWRISIGRSDVATTLIDSALSLNVWVCKGFETLVGIMWWTRSIFC
jgi:hypothetical protein